MKMNQHIARTPKDLEGLEFKKMKAAIKKDLKRLEKYTSAEKPTQVILVAEHDYTDKKAMALLLFGKWKGEFKKYAKEEVAKKNKMGAMGLAYYDGIGDDGQKIIRIQLAKGKAKKKTGKLLKVLKKLVPQATHNIIFGEVSGDAIDALEKKLDAAPEQEENANDLAPDMKDEGQVEVAEDQRYSKLLRSNMKEIKEGAKFIKTEIAVRVKARSPIEGDTDKVIDISDLVDEWLELYREASIWVKGLFLPQLAWVKILHGQVRQVFKALLALGMNSANGRMPGDTTVDDIPDEVEQPNNDDSTTTTEPADDTTGPATDDNNTTPQLKGNYPIKKSVGDTSKAVNDEKDVITIQQILVKKGYSTVKVTGVCDDATKKAIADYQKNKMGTKSPDGRVDAGGGTWFHLLTGKKASAGEKRVLRVEQYSAQIEKAAAQYGMRADHLKAIMAVESGGVPDASSGAAFGLMQLTKNTWGGIQKKYPELANYDFATYWKDPNVNILFGAAALKSKAKSMGVKTDDPNFIVLAVTAYNAGQGTVKYAMQNAVAGGSKDPGKDFIKPEYMKPAIEKAGIHKYYLTGNGKSRNTEGTVQGAVDLKYKEVSGYGVKVESYLEMQETLKDSLDLINDATSVTADDNNNNTDTNPNDDSPADTGNTDDNSTNTDPSPTTVSIEQGVGKGEPNQEKDVLVIQKLLNKNGASPKLTEDSDYGSKTEAAIVAFQKRLGFKNPDAIISPGGKTFKGLIAGNVPANDDTNTNPNTNTDPQPDPAVLEDAGTVTPPTSTGETDSKSATKLNAEGKIVENNPIRMSVGAKRYNSPNDVITVQRLLKAKGYDVPVNGDCDSKTIDAIKAFQKKVKLKNPDGAVDNGGTTWGKLGGNPIPKSNPTGTLQWKNSKHAYLIGNDQKVVDAVQKKYDTDPNSPKNLPDKKKVEKGANGGYLLGVAQVERPMESSSNLNTAYGTIDGTKIDDDAYKKAFASKNITTITAPFPMLNVYNGRLSTKIYVNKKVASSLKAAFKDLLAFYGDAATIQELGLNRYGGCFVFRNIRGGSRPSTHAWGVAIDMCPRLNPLKHPTTGKTSGLNKHSVFAEDHYKAFLKIFEKNGWYNLGECKDYDYMHFQAAVPKGLTEKRAKK